MRITGPGSTGSASTRKSERKSASADGGSFADRLKGTGQPAATASGSSATANGAVGAIDALLALQGAPDSASGRSRGLARGHELLDLLEDVRRGVLLGIIPRGRLEQLARLARAGREEFIDPDLAAILDEIELRAEVELAKLDRDISQD